MKEFKVYWTEEITKCVCIEAKNESEAKKKFLNSDYETGEINEEDATFIENSIEVYEE